MDISRKVIIRVKTSAMQLGRVGKNVSANEILYNKNKIGSSFTGRSVTRPLTFEEEKAYLPGIIGVSPDSPNWEEKTHEYWINISAEVPLNMINGEDHGGLELETGFHYPDEKAAKAGSDEENQEWSRYHNLRATGKFYKMKFDKRFKHGRPLELTDYILYRYCLVYGDVANTPDEIGNSPKIRFYMESVAEQNKKVQSDHEFNVKVMQAYLSLIADRNKVDAVVSVIRNKKVDIESRTNATYDLSTTVGKDMFINEYSKAFGAQFMSIINDKRLKPKAFLHDCIDGGLLRRIANSGIIMYDDLQLGATTEEACDFIMADANKTVVEELKARYSALS